MMRVRRCPRLAPLVVAPLALGACMTQQDVAAQLTRALAQPNVPNVAACWEAEFEAAGFRGAYRAEVDFTVEPDGSLRQVAVQSVKPQPPATGADEPGDAPTDGSDALRTCLSRALEGMSIAASGWAPPAAIRVHGFVFSFADGSAEVRADAKAAGTQLLIGPRANRCAGLYAFHPPREAALLDADVAEARSAAERADDVDQDVRARALQRLYDTAIELRRRLEMDAANRELGEESRARTLERRDEAAKLLRDTGATIGCEPPIDF
jgi:hypothetical protein